MICLETGNYKATEISNMEFEIDDTPYSYQSRDLFSPYGLGTSTSIESSCYTNIGMIILKSLYVCIGTI